MAKDHTFTQDSRAQINTITQLGFSVLNRNYMSTRVRLLNGRTTCMYTLTVRRCMAVWRNSDAIGYSTDPCTVCTPSRPTFDPTWPPVRQTRVYRGFSLPAKKFFSFLTSQWAFFLPSSIRKFFIMNFIYWFNHSQQRRNKFSLFFFLSLFFSSYGNEDDDQVLPFLALLLQCRYHHKYLCANCHM